MEGIQSGKIWTKPLTASDKKSIPLTPIITRKQCKVKIDANPIADNVDLLPNVLYYMNIEFDKKKIEV